MPIYEFSCLNCSKDSEQLVRSSDWQGQAECPECGSVNLEKKLSVFAANSAESGSAELPPVRACPATVGDVHWINRIYGICAFLVLMEAWQTLEHIVIRCGLALVLLSVWTWRLNRPTRFRGSVLRIWHKNLRSMDYQNKKCILWAS